MLNSIEQKRQEGFSLATRTLALLSFLLAMNSALFGASDWITSATSNFTVYTTGDRTQAVHLVRALNAEDLILKHTGLVTGHPAKQLSVIAFGDKADFIPYQPKPGVAGFYQPGRNVDYIVLPSLDPQRTRVALHEYAHYLLKNSFSSLPLWLDEGIADVFSSTEWDGGRFRVGSVLPQRVWALKDLSRINLEGLFAVDADSPSYSNSMEGWSFYAQSWALAHMLMLGRDYSSQFPAFLAQISVGHSAADAFQATYGKDLETVKRDLALYWTQGTVPCLTADFENAVSAEPVFNTADRIEVDLTLADVLASDPYRQADAEARLTELSARYPENASVEESLAYLQIRQHRDTDAREHMLNAIRRGSVDGDLICRYAATLSRDPAGAAESVRLLQRVLSLQPGDYRVRLLVASGAVKVHDFKLAVSTLSEIEKVQPKDAYQFFYTLAYCDVRLKNFRGGQAFGLKARGYATTPQEQFQTEQLLRFVANSQVVYGARRPGSTAD